MSTKTLIQNPVVSFTSGFLLSIALIVSSFLYFLTADFSITNPHNLREIESQNLEHLLFLAKVIPIAFIAFLLLLGTGKKYTALGFFCVPLTLLAFKCMVFFKVEFHNGDYNEAIWKQEKVKPFEMAKVMVEGHDLDFLTMEELIAKLGPGEVGYEWNGYYEKVAYQVEDGWELRVYHDCMDVNWVEFERETEEVDSPSERVLAFLIPEEL